MRKKKSDQSGIHRTERALTNGKKRKHHYAWRGGPKFWTSDMDFPENSQEYYSAFAKALEDVAASKGKFREIIQKYIGSGEFKSLSPRYQKDIKTSINHPKNGIDAKFGDAPIAAFHHPKIRGVVMDWRDKIGGKVGDDRKDHLTKIITWAYDRGDVTEHRLRGIKKLYRSNRANIVWLDKEIETFVKNAPPHVARILIAASETGLRPGDLHQLSMENIQDTPKGRRILVEVRKGNRKRQRATIPVTPRMAELIDTTPTEQTRFLVTSKGHPWSHENNLGDAVSEWRDRLGLRSEIRLYDARGTAITRLFMANLELKEIAAFTGWSIETAAKTIEHYVALHPSMADDIGAKLELARTQSVNAPVNGDASHGSK